MSQLLEENNVKIEESSSTKELIKVINQSNFELDNSNILPLTTSTSNNNNHSNSPHNHRIFIGAKPNKIQNNNTSSGIKTKSIFSNNNYTINHNNPKGIHRKKVINKPISIRTNNKNDDLIQNWKGISFKIGEQNRSTSISPSIILPNASSNSIPAFNPIDSDKGPVESQSVAIPDTYYDTQSNFNNDLIRSQSLTTPTTSVPKSILLENSSLLPPLPLNTSNSFLSVPIPTPSPNSNSSVKEIVKVKSKSVQFQSTSDKSVGAEEGEEVLRGDEEPLPILEVLSRLSDSTGMVIDSDHESGIEVVVKKEEEKKLKLVQQIPQEDDNQREIKSTKMLVKTVWSNRIDLPNILDEINLRKFSSNQFFPSSTSGGGVGVGSNSGNSGSSGSSGSSGGRNEFVEFELRWEMGRRVLELWSCDSSSKTIFKSPSKPKLIHKIPLHKFKTKLSNFSSGLSTSTILFSLHHPSSLLPTSHTLRNLQNKVRRKKLSERREGEEEYGNGEAEEEEGTEIYLFRSNCNSEAKKWMWYLFLELNNGTNLNEKLPKELEIKVPDLGEGINLKIIIPKKIFKNKKLFFGFNLFSVDDDAKVEEEEEEEEEGEEELTVQKIIEISLNQLSTIRDWKELILNHQHQQQSTSSTSTTINNLNNPYEINLVWKRGNFVLDPILFNSTTSTDKAGGDEEGMLNLLSGFALISPTMKTTLELRPISHASTYLSSTTMSNSQIEPPAIEGFLNRIKLTTTSTNTNKNGAGGGGGNGVGGEGTTQERIYLSTIENFLWILKPFDCFLPFDEINHDDHQEEDLGEEDINEVVKEGVEEGVWKRFFSTSGNGNRMKNGIGKGSGKGQGKGKLVEDSKELKELNRIRTQILNSKGYIDLIFDVKEIHLVLPLTTTSNMNENGKEKEGREGVDKKEKVESRDERSWLILLNNGREIRFECNSRLVAIEWINRLNSLQTYFKLKSKQFAKDQMEFQSKNLISLRQQNNGINLQGGGEDEGSKVEDKNYLNPLLNQFYNRCLKDGCRSIINHGSFYIKQEGEIYQKRYLFLLPSSILIYESITRSTLTGLATYSSLLTSKKTILSLKNSYIYTGILIEPFKTTDKNNFNGEISTSSGGTSGRIYPTFGGERGGGDGLESYDEEEECTFILFKKSEKGKGKKGTNWIFRTRNRIERDSWIFAIDNCLERFSREA